VRSVYVQVRMGSSSHLFEQAAPPQCAMVRKTGRGCGPHRYGLYISVLEQSLRSSVSPTPRQAQREDFPMAV
jgi:hypothetical protein